METLPAIQSARLPQSYVQACTALERCTRIDECQDWADKAEALASYAKQSQDDSLRKMADRIQARAIRRCGVLLKEIEPAKGGQPFQGNHTREGALPSSRKGAATEAGLSEFQRKTALRVANVDAEEFELLVESETPPTVTALAERGKQSSTPAFMASVAARSATPGFSKATDAVGALKRLAQFCSENEPTLVAGGVMPNEILAVTGGVKKILSWLDSFICCLEERKED